MILAAPAEQNFGFDKRTDAFFQEKWITFRTLDQNLFQRLQARIVSQNRLEQFLGALGQQWVNPQLAIVRLAAPTMPVFRPVVDEKEKRCSGQAIDQAVQERLGLRIDPMQILEDQEQRLNLTLAQQQPLDRFQGALAALKRI